MNVLWKHNAASRPEERTDIFTAILGFSARITNDMTGIIDIVRRQEQDKNNESNIAELGVRYQLNPLTVVSAGGGYGFGDESPKLRIMLGIQRSF